MNTSGSLFVCVFDRMDDDWFGGYKEKGKSIVDIDDEQALEVYSGSEDLKADPEVDHIELMEHCEGDSDVEDPSH